MEVKVGDLQDGSEAQDPMKGATINNGKSGVVEKFIIPIYGCHSSGYILDPAASSILPQSRIRQEARGTDWRKYAAPFRHRGNVLRILVDRKFVQRFLTLTVTTL